MKPQKIKYLIILILSLSLDKGGFSQENIDRIINTVNSGALLNPNYSKFVGGDSYYKYSNSYIADQVHEQSITKAIKEKVLQEDNIDDLIKKLSGESSIASAEASRNLNSLEFSKYNFLEEEAKKEVYVNAYKKINSNYEKQVKMLNINLLAINDDTSGNTLGFWKSFFNNLILWL